MTPDPIVEEVRAIRDEIAKEHSYDVNAIFEMLRRLDSTNAGPHVSLPARRIDGSDQHAPPSDMERLEESPPEQPL